MNGMLRITIQNREIENRTKRLTNTARVSYNVNSLTLQKVIGEYIIKLNKL